MKRSRRENGDDDGHGDEQGGGKNKIREGAESRHSQGYALAVPQTQESHQR